MPDVTEITSGLQFPEGPIAMRDGSVVLVEIKRQTLTRVRPDGSQEVIAELGGGPNGAALGPDGRCYVCNNGGFTWSAVNGLTLPGDQPDDYQGGSIQVVDLATGAVETLYAECDGVKLRGPNDLVFDAEGGFFFSDLGKTRHRDRDRGGVFYAKADGSAIQEVIWPLETPNGVGLSPDGTRLYVAETLTGRLHGFDLTAPGEVATAAPLGGSLVAGLPGMQLFDSLAVDGMGNICVATIVNGGITSISPDGQTIGHVPTDDLLTTNICFGGEDLRTAYITLSGTGRLVSMPWETAGLALHFAG